jgi:hypothetical protein
MRFSWKSGPILAGQLLYRHAEYSIDFVPSSNELTARVGSSGTGSISIGTLQLEVSIDTGEILFPWGLLPHTRWIDRPMAVPNALPGRLFLSDISVLVPGGAVDLPGGGTWQTHFDSESGWLYTSGDDTADVVVKFAANSGASIASEQLTGLWLKPIHE